MNMRKTIQNNQMTRINRILIVVLLSALATYIVFVTGGTKSAWPQLYFVIILLAAYYWKIWGGVFIALILGLLSGPLMPLDTAKGIMQSPLNWIIRMLMYTSVGFLMGYILKKNNQLTLRMSQKDLTSQFTGLYNTNKLFPDLNMMIRNHQRFCLVLFDIRNLGEISKYVDYGILEDIIQKVISGVKLTHEKSDLYSSDYNEYILVLNEYDEHNLGKIIFSNLENILTSVGIDHYAFHLIIKAGIVFSGDPADEAIDLFNKARIASNQGEEYESSVHTYNPDFDS
ncbi:MAG: hypothetical protein GX858_07940, partial [Clostridiales bacterium]|nr:hypothetical protein [Clostridiales bacterium]